MPRPRADFECKPCGVKAGTEPVVYQNLPVASVFCPGCGKRRGFRRLFNAVQVSTRGHRAAKFIDKQMRPAFDKHAAVKASAKNFETAATQALDKTFEQAPPERRAAMMAAQQQGHVAHAVPAKAAYGAIDPSARADSRQYTWPVVPRTVVPQWQR